MKEPVSRGFSQRDLHQLSTADLLTLIREDIQDLDRLIKTRPAGEQEEKGQGRRPGGRKRNGAGGRVVALHSKQVTLDQLEDSLAAGEDEEPEQVAFFTVTCCNHAMGEFLASARVRCPFCGVWHRAGDFPQAAR